MAGFAAAAAAPALSALSAPQEPVALEKGVVLGGGAEGEKGVELSVEEGQLIQYGVGRRTLEGLKHHPPGAQAAVREAAVAREASVARKEK
jgi:hypothetical protein